MRKKPECKIEEHAILRQRFALVDAKALEQTSRLFKAIGEVPRSAF